jgi:hypothetical protein
VSKWKPEPVEGFAIAWRRDYKGGPGFLIANVYGSREQAWYDWFKTFDCVRADPAEQERARRRLYAKGCRVIRVRVTPTRPIA